MTTSTIITHVALKTGSNIIHGTGSSAEIALEDALLGLAEGEEEGVEFTAFPISDRMSACYSFDYNPTEAEILIVDGKPVAELRAASEIAYYAENIEPKVSKVTHVVLFANGEGGIQETGSSAEGAIAAAVKAIGADKEIFVAKPVTPRMSAVLASGQVPDSWLEFDGVVDTYLS